MTNTMDQTTTEVPLQTLVWDELAWLATNAPDYMVRNRAIKEQRRRATEGNQQ